MPELHFKNREAYRKYEAYKHIHGLSKSHDLNVVYIAGHRHKIQHHLF